MPYNLISRDDNSWFLMWELLLQQHKKKDFLTVITGNKKCIHYNKPKNRKNLFEILIYLRWCKDWRMSYVTLELDYLKSLIILSHFDGYIHLEAISNRINIWAARTYFPYFLSNHPHLVFTSASDADLLALVEGSLPLAIDGLVPKMKPTINSYMPRSGANIHQNMLPTIPLPFEDVVPWAWGKIKMAALGTSCRSNKVWLLSLSLYSLRGKVVEIV